MSKFFDKLLSKYHCGFGKGFNSQHCLASMLEKWWKALHNRGCSKVILTGLSNVFDCLLHDFLIAKLYVYDFGMKFLKFIYSYLKVH